MGPYSIINIALKKLNKYANGAKTVAEILLGFVLLALVLGLVAALVIAGGWFFALCWNYGVVGTFAVVPALTTLKAAAILIVLGTIGDSLGLKGKKTIVVEQAEQAEQE